MSAAPTRASFNVQGRYLVLEFETGATFTYYLVHNIGTIAG